MYNTVIGVGAAVLVGGVALYTGYQLTRDGDEAIEARSEQVAASTREETRASLTTGRGGAPTGEAALDFAEGAAGDRIEREMTPEERRDAERLAALGEGGLLSDEAEVGSGDTDLAVAPIGAAGGDGDDADAFADTRLAEADQEVRTPPGGGLRGALRDADDADDADSASAREPSDARGAAQARAVVRNASLTDKPDVARNTPLTDKPDTRFASRRLVDKPDNSPYFAATDQSKTFDPCTKADGTPYVGPGTAINPFADGDPCLPKATGQAFEVAAVASRPGLVTASDVGSARLRVLPFTNLVRPGFLVAPPVGGDFGSDYRQ